MHKLYLLLSFSICSTSVFAQAPADEDFSDETPTNYTNLASTLTTDGVIYFQDGVPEDGQYIEIFESAAYNLMFPPGSNALIYNTGQAGGGTNYGFRSENEAEFRLASMIIDIYGVGGFATQYVIRGYRDGTEQVSQTVDFATSATYGSVTYTRNGTYYMGGTLSFSATAEWKNIDEVRLYWNNNSGMVGALKSIDFEPAITGTLPVTLLDYTASLQSDGHVKVQWSTADEINNSHFLIERAVNNGEFSVIGRVEGNGTMAHRTGYSFTDQAPAIGTNYYRLVQYDFTGGHKTYKTLSVRKQLDGTFSVFPNPITGKGFTVKLDKPSTAPVYYTLTHMSGKVIATGSITNQQQFIPLSSPLAKGTYLLTMSNGSSVKLLSR